jgi:hypothetical protein
MARGLVWLTVVAFSIAGCTSGPSGQAQCEAAGGQCVLGNVFCENPGPQDCNQNENPGGAFCCLQCAAGTALDDAGTACVGAE